MKQAYSTVIPLGASCVVYREKAIENKRLGSKVADVSSSGDEWKSRYRQAVAQNEELSQSETGFMKYCRFGIPLLSNLSSFYMNANVEIKQKLLIGKNAGSSRMILQSRVHKVEVIVHNSF